MAIDNLQMARIARLAGAPMDKGAGIELYKKLGDEVRESEPIYRIYSEFSADFEFARQAANIDNGYTIGGDTNG
jgi:thymidine phosphorylase